MQIYARFRVRAVVVVVAEMRQSLNGIVNIVASCY